MLLLLKFLAIPYIIRHEEDIHKADFEEDMSVTVKDDDEEQQRRLAIEKKRRKCLHRRFPLIVRPVIRFFFFISSAILSLPNRGSDAAPANQNSICGFGESPLRTTGQ